MFELNNFYFFLSYAILFNFDVVVLDEPLDFSLDDCIEYIQEDELVEVTPKSVRMCKNPKMTRKNSRG